MTTDTQGALELPGMDQPRTRDAGLVLAVRSSLEDRHLRKPFTDREAAHVRACHMLAEAAETQLRGGRVSTLHMTLAQLDASLERLGITPEAPASSGAGGVSLEDVVSHWRAGLDAERAQAGAS